MRAFSSRKFKFLAVSDAHRCQGVLNIERIAAFVEYQIVVEGPSCIRYLFTILSDLCCCVILNRLAGERKGAAATVEDSAFHLDKGIDQPVISVEPALPGHSVLNAAFAKCVDSNGGIGLERQIALNIQLPGPKRHLIKSNRVAVAAGIGIPAIAVIDNEVVDLADALSGTRNQQLARSLQIER